MGPSRQQGEVRISVAVTSFHHYGFLLYAIPTSERSSRRPSDVSCQLDLSTQTASQKIANGLSDASAVPLLDLLKRIFAAIGISFLTSRRRRANLILA